jgi:hypothetical protein
MYVLSWPAEVYIRRVYRSHTILSINVQEVDGVITADWTFRFSDTPPAESPTRRGFFTVYPTVDAYKKGGKSMVRRNTVCRPIGGMNLNTRC